MLYNNSAISRKSRAIWGFLACHLFPEQIKNSQEVLGGVKEHKEEFIEKGYTTEKYVTDFETLLNNTIELNNKQEKAKAALSSTTEELNQNLDDLRKQRQTFKQLVRSYVPKTKWKSFGMTFHARKKNSGGEPEEVPDDTADDNKILPLPPDPKTSADSGASDTRQNPESSTQ